MSDKNPYAGLPRYQIWKRAVSDREPDDVDPQHAAKFVIDRSTKIASAGSCFAQRMAARLSEAGYDYFVTEPGPIWESAQWRKSHNYGTYSARYGDIYTTLHLAQLARQCKGTFRPAEPAWTKTQRYFDPLRPRIEPDGFRSLEELQEDRSRHIAAVRELLSNSDIFVFTLGLTETWCSSIDDMAFPMCPGVAGFGSFDHKRHYFRNLTVDDNVAYLEEFLDYAWSLNPTLRVILTVSPVPLAATYESRHVVASTTYSKAVLRVAAESICQKHQNVDYFAAYEIVTGTCRNAEYFDSDRRSVTALGVDRVMRSFFAAYTRDEMPAVTLKELTPSQLVRDPCDDDVLMEYMVQQRVSRQ
jgi:hypothetical protein